MTTIGKLWTASIAYVALAVGAGLSIMYNVVDTMTVRGPALDVYDVVTAVAAPAIVVLMVELFVSNWWVNTRWPMQALRWLGCLVIGGVAMRASWTHGHDFMARRGQAADVAITWPLAIDLLAVMATALILAGRRARMSADSLGQSRTVSDADIRNIIDPAATARLTMLPDMTADGFASGSYVRTHATGNPWTDAYVPADTDKLNDWVSGQQRADTDIGETLAREAEQYMWRTPADTRPLPRRTRTASGLSAPADFVAMAAAWDPEQLERADMVKLSAAYFEVSARTARRWLSAVLNEPVSPA